MSQINIIKRPSLLVSLQALCGEKFSSTVSDFIVSVESAQDTTMFNHYTDIFKQKIREMSVVHMSYSEKGLLLKIEDVLVAIYVDTNQYNIPFLVFDYFTKIIPSKRQCYYQKLHASISVTLSE